MKQPQHLYPTAQKNVAVLDAFLLLSFPESPPKRLTHLFLCSYIGKQAYTPNPVDFNSLMALGKKNSRSLRFIALGIDVNC